MTGTWRVARVVFWLVTDVWARVGWFGYTFCVACREVLAGYPFLPHGCGLFSGSYFPSFSEGLSLREHQNNNPPPPQPEFPFLFGGTFIEGSECFRVHGVNEDFPSFSEGLSLRVYLTGYRTQARVLDFPSFSEGLSLRVVLPLVQPANCSFPFLFGGTFIEGKLLPPALPLTAWNFPSFSEGLSLRAGLPLAGQW